MTRFVFLLFASFVVITCSTLRLDVDGKDISFNYYDYLIEDVQEMGSNSDLGDQIVSREEIIIGNVLKRAQQIAGIKWTPLDVIPNNIDCFDSGIEVRGIPYSSVKEKDKFVGLDVSFKTFMTAVHNPRSVMYTENVRQEPYRGTNCAAYYGTVCSAAVNYALGFRANYTTSMIDTLSFFFKVPVQNPDSIQLCDVLWSPGHEVMVCGIQRDDQEECITSVSILESAGIGTSIHGYSFDDFITRWRTTGWVLYRYNFENWIDHYHSVFVGLNDENNYEYLYNTILCPSRGDDAVYREGEDVIINMLDDSFVKLFLYADGSLIESRMIECADIVLNNLSSGSYVAYAVDSMGNESDHIHFEVVDATVSADNLGGVVEVTFSSKHGRPIYVTLCNERGDRYLLRELNQTELDTGKVIVRFPDKIASCYCKVFFETPYGTVTNEPILVSR